MRGLHQHFWAYRSFNIFGFIVLVTIYFRHSDKQSVVLYFRTSLSNEIRGTET